MAVTRPLVQNSSRSSGIMIIDPGGGDGPHVHLPRTRSCSPGEVWCSSVNTSKSVWAEMVPNLMCAEKDANNAEPITGGE
eukprot:6617434-Pyramimonas_sp.AAC.1